MPDVPVRQWVRSLPFPLRYPLAHDPDRFGCFYPVGVEGDSSRKKVGPSMVSVPSAPRCTPRGAPQCGFQ